MTIKINYDLSEILPEVQLRFSHFLSRVIAWNFFSLHKDKVTASVLMHSKLQKSLTSKEMVESYSSLFRNLTKIFSTSYSLGYTLGNRALGHYPLDLDCLRAAGNIRGCRTHGNNHNLIRFDRFSITLTL